jgi:hypothetical protein
MHEWELGYMAGLIDGEGSISIGRAPACGNQKHDTYKLVLQVYMSTEEPLNTVVKWFGGKVEVLPIQTERFGQNIPGRQWRANGRKAIDILKMVRPYLILKRPQADLAIEYLEWYETTKGIGRTQPTEDTYLIREYYWDKMRELNRR